MSEYKINELISWRSIDGQILILDSHINESAHELNEIGSFIFEKISQGKNLFDIKKELQNFYPSQPKIEDDFKSFIKDLEKLKLILPVSPEK